MDERPFQFWLLGRLFGAATLICLGLGEVAWVWSAGSRPPQPDYELLLSGFGVAGATVGASLGMLFRQPIILFALIGAFLSAILFVVYAVIAFLIFFHILG
jgi:hypothetical protein